MLWRCRSGCIFFIFVKLLYFSSFSSVFIIFFCFLDFSFLFSFLRVFSFFLIFFIFLIFTFHHCCIFLFIFYIFRHLCQFLTFFFFYFYFYSSFFVDRSRCNVHSVCLCFERILLQEFLARATHGRAQSPWQ